MNRIPVLKKDEADTQVQSVWTAMEKKMGRVPNIFLHMGHSPQALKAFVAMSELVEQTSLSKTLKEQIALLTAESNHCHYCLSAHSAIAKGVGLSNEQILNARKGHGQNEKDQVILDFVKKVILARGSVSDQDVEALKANGVTPQEICDITLTVTLNLYTNYFNQVVHPEIDFPEAPSL